MFRFEKSSHLNAKIKQTGREANGPTVHKRAETTPAALSCAGRRPRPAQPAPARKSLRTRKSRHQLALATSIASCTADLLVWPAYGRPNGSAWPAAGRRARDTQVASSVRANCNIVQDTQTRNQMRFRVLVSGRNQRVKKENGRSLPRPPPFSPWTQLPSRKIMTCAAISIT